MDHLEEFMEAFRAYRPEAEVNNFVDSPRRVACYAIHCLLSHVHVASNTFADPTDLLKLMGLEMTWPPQLEAKILQSVLETVNRTTRKPESLRSLLAGQDRKVWGAYIETVSELYDVEPQTVLAAFETKLLELVRSDAEIKSLNPTLVMLSELLGLNTTESKLLSNCMGDE